MVAKQWTYPNRAGAGRPQVDDTVVALIERMAQENTGWGYRRIQGELLELGHRIAASTVRRVLKRLRIPPDFRFMVRDRAGQVAASFDSVLADAGIDVVKIPPRCPWADCYAERFVGTVRRELTDRLLIINEHHLKSVLNRYVSHYNHRRPHRARRHTPPRPDHPIAEPDCRSVRRRQILGGLINEYEPAAA
ncbi:integrase core domain-containing protein [Lentzea waywayandensis]|uniref:integrase core domain-containing protein n=1 Tax=Lentzea waywayandensis TaxID=84724 RepID=UPI000A4334E4|nr:integrase core domain-containing protein [Lentzea waywayandensis]